MTQLSRLRFLTLLSIFLTSCNLNLSPLLNQEPSDSSIPSNPTNEITITGHTDIHRSTTASQGFSIALNHATEKFDNPDWYGIIPFTSIERTLAIPLDSKNPSWFYRFGVPGENIEYYIEVRNGLIIGTNQIILPDYIEPQLREIEPLGREWLVLDNAEALQICLDNGCMLSEYPSMVIDYRLSKPKGSSNPIWTLYNAKNITTPIMEFDAITGEILNIQDNH